MNICEIEIIAEFLNFPNPMELVLFRSMLKSQCYFKKKFQKKIDQEKTSINFIYSPCDT